MNPSCLRAFLLLTNSGRDSNLLKKPSIEVIISYHSPHILPGFMTTSREKSPRPTIHLVCPVYMYTYCLYCTTSGSRPEAQHYYPQIRLLKRRDQAYLSRKTLLPKSTVVKYIASILSIQKADHLECTRSLCIQHKEHLWR